MWHQHEINAAAYQRVIKAVIMKAINEGASKASNRIEEAKRSGDLSP